MCYTCITYVHCILHHLITGKQDTTWVSYTISVMDKIIMIVYICYQCLTYHTQLTQEISIKCTPTNILLNEQHEIMKSVHHYYMQVRHSMQLITKHYFKKLKTLVKKMHVHVYRNVLRKYIIFIWFIAEIYLRTYCKYRQRYLLPLCHILSCHLQFYGFFLSQTFKCKICF